MGRLKKGEGNLRLKSSLMYVLLIIVIVVCMTGCNKKKDENRGVNSRESELEGELVLQSDNEITFSKTKYFYSSNIEIKILSNKSGKIYYSTDGTEPSKSKNIYKNPIKLKAGKKIDVISLKAKAYFDDGTESNTIIHTYFVGKDVNYRFDTLVFSITTDPYHLYDYEYGIFVEGKLRDDYIKANPGVKIEPPAPANFNMRGRESERPVFLEVFEPDGKKVVDQTVGIRTYGGWSRAHPQKSIKIFARKEYDEENNKLRYPFFPEKTATNGDGTILDSFKCLVLRNSGNDNGFAFIRDELFQTLAAQAGYQDYQAVRPATLFINGEYRGCFWLHEVYSDEYFEENYGDYSGSFEILEGGELYKELDDDGKNKIAVADYEAMYSYASKDLTEDKHFQELCQWIDVENYLSYYALQIYIGNNDWPHNNYKTYRYYAADKEEYREPPFDGKWRYLLHDLDFSFDIYDRDAIMDNINAYLGDAHTTEDKAPLFRSLMKREDCKELFVKKTLDLLNGAFAPDNINQVLEDMNSERMNEQNQMYGKNLMADWVARDQLEYRLDKIRIFGTDRAKFILNRYQKYFNLGEIYELSITPAPDCGIKINSFVTNEYFEGHYYMDYDTVISAILPAGKEFDYWLVNGEKIKEKELTITSSMVHNGKVQVSCVLKEEGLNPQLIFLELVDQKEEDYFILSLRGSSVDRGLYGIR